MANNNNKNTALNTVSPLTVKTLIDTGLFDKASASKEAANVAKAAIRDAGGYFPEGGSDALALVANNVLSNSRIMSHSGRAIALSLAVIEESGEYKRVLSPYGKPFKSCGELFRALFPSLADSTINSYLNVGREIYLPAKRGTLPKEFTVLATLEPGTALSAVGALRDETVKPHLGKAITEAMVERGGKLSQSALKAAVKSAKEAAKLPAHGAEVEPTDKKDATAQHKTSVEAMRAAMNKVWRKDDSGDEIHLYFDKDDKADWKELVNNALKSPEAALLFVEAFKALTM